MPPATGTRVPKVSLHVPGFEALYLNQPVAALPFGLTEPFSVAVVSVTLVGEIVVTNGEGNDSCLKQYKAPG